MAFGHRRRRGERGKKKGGHGETVDGRCSVCGGVEGRHNQVRVSRPVRDSRGIMTGRYKIAYERCPNA